MGIDSRPISERRVYAQDTAPEGRDGILWVDTSEQNRTTYVYSSEIDDWVNVAPDQTTEINEAADKARKEAIATGLII